MNTTDVQLLDQWRTHHDADAFAELVSRHADMVYATCLRVLRNGADAEDAAQECFVILMKSRPAVGTSLAPWLYTVARRRALDIVRGNYRREQRERKNSLDLGVSVERDRMDLLAWTDEAIADLPESLRVPVVERFLAGRKHNEIAGALGISEATVRHRIGKGVEQIRQVLQRRGVSLTVAAIVAMLGTDFAGAAPLGLKAGLGKLAIASPGTTVAPAWAAAGGMVAMKKIGILVGVLVGALVAGIWALKAVERTGNPSMMVTGASEGRALETTARATSLPEPSASLATATTSPEAASPVANADRVLEPCEIADPVNYASVSGHVRNEAGEPVAGAEVMLAAQGYEEGENAKPTMEWAGRALREDHHFHSTTGGDGAFTISGIRFRGWAMLYAYVNQDNAVQGRDNLVLKEGERKEGVVLTVSPAVLLRGRVLSATGQPVADAVVRNMWGDGIAPADLQGAFELAYERNHEIAILSVYSPTHGVATFPEVPIEPGTPMVLTLPGAAILRGRVAWHDGTPPDGLRIVLQGSVVIGWQTSEDGSRSPGTSRIDMSYESPISESGRYELAGLDPGQYYFKVTVEDKSGMRYADDQLGFLPANQVTTWDPIIAGSGYVYGTIRGEFSGEILRDADLAVWAVLDDRAIESAQVNRDGTYRLQLPATNDEYLICPSFDPYTYNGFEVYGKKVRVKPGLETELDLMFKERYTATVRVVDAQGVPIVGAEVHRHDPGHNGLVGLTDKNGIFTHKNMMPDFSDVQSLSTLVIHHPDYTKASTLPREGASGAVYPEEVIVLYRKAGIVGRVVNAEGMPVTGAAVSVGITYDVEHSTGVEMHTNSGGFFRSEDGVPATAVSAKMSIQHDDARSETLELEPQTVAPGSVLDLGDLVFEPKVEEESDEVEKVETE